MDVADQIELRRLLQYTGDTAGTLMTTDYISIPEKLSVKDFVYLTNQLERIQP